VRNAIGLKRRKRQCQSKRSALPALVKPSTPELDFHLGDIVEAVDDFRRLVTALGRPRLTGERRATLEGELYAALFHLNYHVRPAIQEWDRISDQQPDA
jgi:hypothetical protein